MKTVDAREVLDAAARGVVLEADVVRRAAAWSAYEAAADASALAVHVDACTSNVILNTSPSTCGVVGGPGAGAV